MSLRPNRLNGPNAIDAVCADCGLKHDTETRARVVRRLLPCTASEALAAYPCLLVNSKTAQRALAAARIRRAA